MIRVETAQARKETKEGREMMRRNGGESLSHKATTQTPLTSGYRRNPNSMHLQTMKTKAKRDTSIVSLLSSSRLEKMEGS
jgi:hypothetical protein